jgi:hypothetical protein
MNRRQFTFDAVSAAALTAADAQAQTCSSGKVGELRDVVAWVNRMPGPGARPSLHIVGRIVTATPCHDASAQFTGDSKSNPPLGMFKVTVTQRPGICIQCIAEVPFRYDDPNYSGTYASIEVSSDHDKKTIQVGTAS